MGKAVVVEGGTGNTVIITNGMRQAILKIYGQMWGDKSTLITTDKSSLVKTVNENRESINNLDANKVDNSRVLTDVPVNAKFTDKHIWVGEEGSKGTDANTIYFCY